MAFPTVEFNSVHPFLMKGGIKTEVHLSVVTNTVGKSQLSLSLTAPSCSFLNGSKEVTQEIETTSAGELTEVSLSIVILSKKNKILFIRLKAEIVNADKEADKSRLTVRLDNREGLKASDVHPTSSPGAIISSTPVVSTEIAPDSVPDPEVDSTNSETAVIDENTTVADTLPSEADQDTATETETDSNSDSNSIINPA